jgi:hypothetical protein
MKKNVFKPTKTNLAFGLCLIISQSLINSPVWAEQVVKFEVPKQSAQQNSRAKEITQAREVFAPKEQVNVPASLILQPSSNFSVGGVGQGGGAFVKKDGIWMSFYEAGLYVKPVAPGEQVGAPNLPEIQEVVQIIMGLDFISIKKKQEIVASLMPQDGGDIRARRYFIANPDLMTEENYKRIIEVYSKKTNLNPDQISLAAVTDIPNRTTYLLPGYFDPSVSHKARLANIFHEAYWLMFPNATYNDVISAEMAFQAVLENPKDGAALYDFAIRVGVNNQEAARIRLAWEIQSGALKGFVDQNNQFKLIDLIGKEAAKCFKDGSAYDRFDTTECHQYVMMNLTKLVNQYPKSTTLRKIQNYFVNRLSSWDGTDFLSCSNSSDSNFWFNFLRYKYDVLNISTLAIEPTDSQKYVMRHQAFFCYLKAM